MSQELFSVCQFFPDGSYEYVRRNVSASQAMHAARHYCTSVGAKLGTTKRVIITDGGDSICYEWTHDDGIIFGVPSEHMGRLKNGRE